MTLHDASEPKPSEDRRKLLLNAQGLRKSFGGKLVLGGIDLRLHQGEVVLLRGENGSGKTTLLNILTGNMEPDSGMIQVFTNSKEERFYFPRRWWQKLNPFDHFTPERVSKERVGRSWQDIRLFSTQTLRDNIAISFPQQLGESPLWALIRRSAVQKQERNIILAADSVLSSLHLDGREDSSADQVSLGQSKRVAIARAVSTGARILFLDEPLAGLDASGVTEVMDLLKELVGTHKITLVIIEHILNITHVLSLATTVWTLDNEKIRVSSPDDIHTEINQGVGDDNPSWIAEIQGSRGTLANQTLPGGAILSTLTIPSTNSHKATLEIEDLVIYRGKRLAVGEKQKDGSTSGVTFSLRRGQLVVLQAPNGWGKTTLLEAIAGLIPITRGVIRLNGQPVEHLSSWERSSKGLSLLQSRNNIFLSLTVSELLRLTKRTILPARRIEHLLDRHISDLSGGERQKVALLSTIGRHLIVGLLDEPFASLDSQSTSEAQALLTNCLLTGALLITIPSAVAALKCREQSLIGGKNEIPFVV